MKLQTKIPIKKQLINQIDYNSNILLLGSCFSENISDKLSYFKFQSSQNPFGILFHPKAIENLLDAAIQDKIYKDEDLVFQNERWHCFEAHSRLSSLDKNALLENLNLAILQTKKKVKEATHITITLGTAWVYKFIETGKIVANCHKIPQNKFLKTLLNVDEITQSLKNTLSLIKSVNKEAKVIFTVSPVRHLKDGFVENTLSKSHLITAIHQVLQENDVFYFPSYEIMMDELRDYRFYTEDMIHPNNTAVNYIWDKFLNEWISENSFSTMKKIDIIQKGLAHKPFNEHSEQYQKFLSNLEKKKATIVSQFKHITF
ncbi:GSCFA domain-containing protein [uncultured Polaribacter sp.]|uniref:GSCFA domain-containing protein n=1 Tax=uncultured Polaribacter sp. TaxID=174711 RepID=UPI0026066599|nr:GSCFA domain-containing protein [uncultured Polaribacter sp.]